MVRSGCYLRPDQFLDHLTVIIKENEISRRVAFFFYIAQLSLPGAALELDHVVILCGLS